MSLTGPLPDMSRMFEAWDRPPRRPRFKPKKCRHDLRGIGLADLCRLRGGQTVKCPGCFASISIGGR